MISFLKKKKLKRELDNLQFDIWMLTKGKWRASGYVRRVFYFLRENMELCKQPEWNRLYDECIYFQIIEARVHSGWTEKRPKDQRGWVELLADLAIKHSNERDMKFTQEEVEKYLEYRKYEWKYLKRPLCC